jgi:peptidyl-dipeptidase A
MLGDLFASQVWTYVAKNFDHVDSFETCFNGERATKIGDYFKEKIFHPGNTMSWEELTIHATHHELSAKSFSEMFVK